jgi:hypothetical protein
MNLVHQVSSSASCLALVTALAVLAAGCGTRAAECAYLCERFATCLDSTEPAGCSAACIAYGTTGGLAGRRTISECASCVAGAGCVGIVHGECDAVCRVPGVDMFGAVPTGG